MLGKVIARRMEPQNPDNGGARRAKGGVRVGSNHAVIQIQFEATRWW